MIILYPNKENFKSVRFLTNPITYSSKEYGLHFLHKSQITVENILKNPIPNSILINNYKSKLSKLFNYFSNFLFYFFLIILFSIFLFICSFFEKSNKSSNLFGLIQKIKFVKTKN